MEYFLESQEKKRELAEINLFVNMRSTYAINFKPDSNKHMNNFKEIYAQTICGTTNLSLSTIYYMEIIGKNPDSDETVRHLAELLLNSATSQHQDIYVVLVGDGKMYEHLIQNKHLYGLALQKLLVFPGDWHTLANFQPEGLLQCWSKRDSDGIWVQRRIFKLFGKMITFQEDTHIPYSYKCGKYCINKC